MLSIVKELFLSLGKRPRTENVDLAVGDGAWEGGGVIVLSIWAQIPLFLGLARK